MKHETRKLIALVFYAVQILLTEIYICMYRDIHTEIYAGDIMSQLLANNFVFAFAFESAIKHFPMEIFCLIE